MGQALFPIGKSNVGKAKAKAKVTVTLPKMSLMAFFGLAGVNLAALPLRSMPAVLDKISNGAKALPGGDIIASICDGAKIAIEAYLTAIDIFNGLMMAITAVKAVADAGIAIGSMGMTVPQTLAKIAGLAGVEALKMAKNAIPLAMKSIQNANIEIGEDGKPSIKV